MLSSDSAQERRIFKTKETGNEKGTLSYTADTRLGSRLEKERKNLHNKETTKSV